MRHTKINKIFNSLNWQFLIYFLLFSYIPLIIFSIIGFFVNKSVINDIHNSYLEEINQIELRTVDRFLENRQHKINNLINNSADLSVDDLLKRINEINRQNTAALLETEKVQSRGGSAQVSKADVWYFDEKNRKIYLKFILQNDKSLFVPVDVAEIQKLLHTVSRNYYHEIICRNKSGDIIITENKIFPARNRVPSRYKDFLKTASVLPDNWLLVTYRTSANLYDKLFTFLKEIFIANLIIGVLLFIAAFFLANKIVNPIRSLAQAAERISKGELSEEIKVEGKNELKTLGDEFENMRKELKEAYSDLELKIDERTNALQEAQFQVSHQEKMASLGLMAAGVAHEIGNPLTSISSMAQIIKRKIDDPKLIQYADTILENIERISHIVHELVDFARPASYRATMVNINEIVKNAVNIVRYDRRAKQIDLKLELQDDLPGVYLVSDQLLQVFINILINAVDALGDMNNLVVVRTYYENENVYIKFIDNGVGIPQKNIDKIFQPFFTTKDVGKGTGLGLSVSYGIIKNLNGKIEVKSKLGEGSEFTVQIPVELNFGEKSNKN